MRLFLLLSLLCGTSIAQAQRANIEQVGAAGQANLNTLANGGAATLYLGRNDGIEGSPYLDPRWLMATLYTNNKVQLAPVALKYDLMNQYLVMRTGKTGKDSVRLDDRALVRFELQVPATATESAGKRVFRRFMDSPNPVHRGQYVEVLHQGQYQLLKHALKLVHKVAAQSGYGTDNRAATLEDKITYFLCLPDGRVQPVKLTPRSLLKAAPALTFAPKDVEAARTEADWVALLERADPR